MAQASTAGTAILRAGRNEGGGNISVNRSGLTQIQEMTSLLQISSHPPSPSTPNLANYAI